MKKVILAVALALVGSAWAEGPYGHGSIQAEADYAVGKTLRKIRDDAVGFFLSGALTADWSAGLGAQYQVNESDPLLLAPGQVVVASDDGVCLLKVSVSHAFGPWDSGQGGDKPGKPATSAGDTAP